MDTADWFPVQVFMPSQVLKGMVHHPFHERLLDRLNSTWLGRLQRQSHFIILADAKARYAGRKEEELPVVYINKAHISLIATPDADSGRGVGAKVGPKPYPFLQKRSAPVRLHVPGYVLSGYIHYASGEQLLDVIDHPEAFFPITDVEIINLADDSSFKVGFVAINRENVLSLQESEAPSA